MREIYIIYNKTTGYIDGGTGRIDRTNIGKMGKAISRILDEKPHREVLYLPDQDLPDPMEHKIKNGKIVKLTKQDKEAIEAAKPKSEIELLKERVCILEEKVK